MYTDITVFIFHSTNVKIAQLKCHYIVLKLLRFPRGSVSWIRLKGIHAITPSTIFGGVDPEGMEEVYICRAFHIHPNGNLVLIPGKFVPTKEKCLVSIGM